jgi:tetratricopeptide (TPR) repeat protein
MLTLEQRAELLMRVAELREASAYRALTDLLDPLSEQQLLEEPELGYSLVLAYYRTDRFDAARRLNETLTARSQTSALERLYRKHLILEGALCVEYGELHTAESLFRQAIAYAIRSDDLWVTADATMNLAILAAIGCRWGEALGSFQGALTAYTSLGRTYSVAACHQNLAMTYRELNLAAEADSHFEKAHQLYSSSSLDRSYELCYVELERALLITGLGDHHRAEAMTRRALSRVAQADAPRRRAEALRVLGIVLRRRGRLQEAQACVEEGRVLAQSVGVPLLEAELCEEMSILSRFSGDATSEEIWAGEAVRLYAASGADARSRRVIERRHETLSA